MQKTALSWEPSALAGRYRSLDIIRGLALFGVLLVNVLSGFRVPLLEHIFSHYAGLGALDTGVELFAAFALEFKALTIFSFLFGVGIAIQMERADARQVSARRFLVRRLLWLFVFGSVHLFLIWNGDILVLYAICGLLLVPLLRASKTVLWIAGAVLIVLPEFVSFGASIPSGGAATALIGQARQIYAHTGYLAILKFRWYESLSLIVPLLLMVLLRTAGLLYWGVAAWRSGILSQPELHRRKLAAVLAIAACAGAAVTANGVWGAYSGHAPWPVLNRFDFAASPLLALAYVAGLLLWLNPRRTARLPGLAALGQMALTNYLMQSILLGFVFYGYGFGLFGRLGSAAAAGIAVLLYALQIQFSRWWLRRFRFGPVEWAWRSLSYGRLQPLTISRSLPN